MQLLAVHTTTHFNVQQKKIGDRHHKCLYCPDFFLKLPIDLFQR